MRICIGLGYPSTLLSYGVGSVSSIIYLWKPKNTHGKCQEEYNLYILVSFNRSLNLCRILFLFLIIMVLGWVQFYYSLDIYLVLNDIR